MAGGMIVVESQVSRPLLAQSVTIIRSRAYKRKL